VKSINTTELLVEPGTQYTDRNYTLLYKSVPSGIKHRPYTGITRIHVRYNKHYRKYTVTTYKNAENLINRIIQYQLPFDYNLDHIINALIHPSHGFVILN